MQNVTLRPSLRLSFGEESKGDPKITLHEIKVFVQNKDVTYQPKRISYSGSGKVQFFL